MSKVFISYARDKSHGEALAGDLQIQLEAADFHVFRDVTGLKGGDYWLQKLEQELRASEFVVLVLSEKILNSKWVRREIILAEQLDIPVIPIFAELIDLPLWLVDLQVLDFSVQHNWQQLFEAIGCLSIVLQHHDDIPTVGEVVSSPQVESDTPMVREVVSSPQADPDIPTVREIVSPSRVDPDIPTVREVFSTTPAFQSFKHDLCNPEWASETGQDQYGQYADLEISKVTQRFRLIHPGTFQMGSLESEKERDDDETLHQVTLSKAFWLADTACTQALWLAVMGNNPSFFTDNKNNPVEQVSWNDVQEFIQALSQLKLDVTVQLPIEAQWEYACRAGTTTPFSFGENMTSEQVNYNGEQPYKNGFFQKKGLFRGETLVVQSLPANQWGLYEMHGNVMEWCRDAYSELSSEACTDPGNPSGDYRVLRGGSWAYGGRYCRSACRFNVDPTKRNDGIGFRLSLVN